MAWFSGPGSSSSHRHSSSSSYYKRRPRDGYFERILYKLKRMFRDLWYYARRNPVKVFVMVIMPLLTGGALTGVLKRFGIRLPPGMFGSAGRGRGGGMGGMEGMLALSSTCKTNADCTLQEDSKTYRRMASI